MLRKTVEDYLEGSAVFVTDITITPANDITVEIDSIEGVDIETCGNITRRIEEIFDRDVEDYSLEVGSAGITSPLKVRAQYTKNIGHDVEVLTADGRKFRGALTAVADGDALDTDIEFSVEVTVKVKEPGAKRPVMRNEAIALKSGECKYVRPELKF